MSYNFTYLNLYLKYRGSSFKIKKDHYVISKVAARHMSTDDLDSVLVVAYPSPSPSSPRPPHHRPSSSSTIEDVPPHPPNHHVAPATSPPLSTIVAGLAQP
jgi:hypothetical protein